VVLLDAVRTDAGAGAKMVVVDGNQPRRRIRDPKRTRQVIIDALLAILSEGDPPTARKIAERAGVSERSIFVHFRDFEDIRLAATEHQAKRVTDLARPIPADASLRTRVDVLIAQREQMFPLQVGVRLAGMVHAKVSDPLARRMAEIDAWFRAQVAEAFAPELEQADDAAELLNILDAVTSWAFRHHLVERQGLTSRQASAAVRRTVLATIAVSL
jgi:AcrR family transcriptional regulator